MKTTKRLFIRDIKSPATVELDTQARAAYVRFSKRAVARTEVVDSTGRCIVTVDFDKDGAVVGVELVGVREFTIGSLIKASGMNVPEKATRGARYLPAELFA